VWVEFFFYFLFDTKIFGPPPLSTGPRGGKGGIKPPPQNNCFPFGTEQLKGLYQSSCEQDSCSEASNYTRHSERRKKWSARSMMVSFGVHEPQRLPEGGMLKPWNVR